MLKIFEWQLLLIEKYIFTVNTVILDLQLFLFLELNWKCDIAKKNSRSVHIFKYVLTCTARGFVPAIHRILLQTERVFFLLLSNYAVAFLGFVYNQFNAYILVYLRGTIWCQDGEPPQTQLQSSVMGRSAKSASSSSGKNSGQIRFDYIGHSFFFKEKNHTTLKIAKVYPVLHEKEVGSEHLSMLGYTAELKWVLVHHKRYKLKLDS